MPEGEEPGRYFFAIWPEAQIRGRLDAWAREIETGTGARRVAADNLHMTLAFLGTLRETQVTAARKVARGMAPEPAVLTLDRIGYWQRPRIIWAGSRDGCDLLCALAENLRERLRRVGFRIDTRLFVPHVTLYRKARRRPKWTSRRIEWPVNDFCLVHSRLLPEGARYEIVERWSANSDVK
jgi:2'-5' RNA ligase